MERWEISNQEIESTEKLLLPEMHIFQKMREMLFAVGIPLMFQRVRGVGKLQYFLPN